MPTAVFWVLLYLVTLAFLDVARTPSQSLLVLIIAMMVGFGRLFWVVASQ